MDVKRELTSQGLYTPNYCEENIYHLIHYLESHATAKRDQLRVVFISNEQQQVPFWHQCAASNEEGAVLWDYHVVLIQPSQRLLWDLDTRLPCPCDLTVYCKEALRTDVTLNGVYHRLYRVISASEYLNGFASDRRHMIKANGEWIAPPPVYPCIKNDRNEVHTLDAYRDMNKHRTEDRSGYILDENSFLLQISRPGEVGKETKK